VALAVVVVEDDEELDPSAGVAVVVMLVVFVVFVSDLVALAGEGFTIVVLVSVFPLAGEAPVVGVTSVLCSQAARSAALARMVMNFFIIFG